MNKVSSNLPTLRQRLNNMLAGIAGVATAAAIAKYGFGYTPHHLLLPFVMVASSGFSTPVKPAPRRNTQSD